MDIGLRIPLTPDAIAATLIAILLDMPAKLLYRDSGLRWFRQRHESVARVHAQRESGEGIAGKKD